MLLIVHHSQIIRPIVCLIAVLMMNVFSSAQVAAEHSFHDKSVFVYVTFDVLGMIRGVDKDISVTINETPASPGMILFPESFAGMAWQESRWIAGEAPPASGCAAVVNRRGLPTTTLAYAAWNLIWLRDVARVMRSPLFGRQSNMMAGNESPALAARFAMPRLRFHGQSATTFAEFHALQVKVNERR